LPCARRYDALRLLACGEIASQLEGLPVATVGDFERQRRAGMEIPDFDGIDAMPMGSFGRA
jgi:hypothetical protein